MNPETESSEKAGNTLNGSRRKEGTGHNRQGLPVPKYQEDTIMGNHTYQQ
jgi:hypothetical protein